MIELVTTYYDGLVYAVIDPITMALIGAGMSLAPTIGSAFKSRSEKTAEGLSEEQRQRSDKLFGELDAQGRPIKRAEVDRLGALLGSDLGISAQERQAAERNIDRATSAGMSGVSSLGGGLRQLGGMTQTGQDAMADLSAQSGAIERGNIISISQMLSKAEAEAEQFNELLPFLEKREEAMSLLDASNQNQYLAAMMRDNRFNTMLGGVGDAGSSLMTFAGTDNAANFASQKTSPATPPPLPPQNKKTASLNPHNQTELTGLQRGNNYNWGVTPKFNG